MPSLRRALLLLPLAALALTGCNDGPTTTEARDVAPFTRIENRDSVDVDLQVGEPQRVRVRAGEKVIDDVRTEVEDGTLQIAFDHDGFGGSEVDVEVAVPELTAIEASSSGDIRAAGVEADAFKLASDGSADIVVAGTAARLTVELDGSGEARLADLAAEEARVTVDGSGDLELRVAQKLDVVVDGSGDVRYYGDPAVTRHVDGSGELSHAG
jgi:hypothetical protein